MKRSTETNTWRDWARPLLLLAALLAVAFVLGAFVVAPSLARRSDTHIPRAVANLKVGVLTVVNADGQSFRVPVRVADTPEVRLAGLRHVGPKAMKTMLILYTFQKVQTAGKYSTDGIRSPIEVAIFDENRNLVEIRLVETSESFVRVTTRHRWLIMARKGLFQLFELGVGAKLPPNPLRWLK